MFDLHTFIIILNLHLVILTKYEYQSYHMAISKSPLPTVIQATVNEIYPAY